VFATGAFGISNVGTAAMDWLKQLSITPTQSAAVSTGVGLVVVFATVLLDTFKEPKAAPAMTGTVYTARATAPVYQQPQAYQPAGYYPPVQQQQPVQAPPKPPKSQRRVPWIIAIVLVLGLCGVGGFALTWGAQWANGQAICKFDPKHYPGTDRLAGGPAQAVSDQLGLEVTRVVVSKCGTIFTVHAVNAGDTPLQLPIYGNTSLTVPGRTSPGGDPFTSDWTGLVPAGGEMTGILVFKTVPPDATQVTLSFATVFGRLGGPRGISVKVPLTPVSES
jgi:hypothetical protein